MYCVVNFKSTVNNVFSTTKSGFRELIYCECSFECMTLLPTFPYSSLRFSANKLSGRKSTSLLVGHRNLMHYIVSLPNTSSRSAAGVEWQWVWDGSCWREGKLVTMKHQGIPLTNHHGCGKAFRNISLIYSMVQRFSFYKKWK